MPEWAVYALVAPFVWCLSNTLDQFLVRYFRQSTFAVLGFVGLTALPFLLPVWWLAEGLQTISLIQAAAGIFAGFIFLAAVYPYLLALKSDDTTAAIPLFQLIPVFTYFFGWLFLDERLTAEQLFGGAIIVAAAFAFSLDGTGFRVNWRVLCLMTASSILHAVFFLFIRVHAPDISSWTMLFLMILGWALCGIAIFAISQPARVALVTQIKTSKGRVLGLGMLQELFDVIAQKFLVMALVLAPTTVHVQLVGGLQTVMIFAIAMLAGWLLPQHFVRQKLDRFFAIKIACVVIMLFGLKLLLEV